MRLTVVLLSICVLTLNSQEHEKKKKEKNIPGSYNVIVQDTTKSERKADTIYLEQSKALNALDSLNQNKKK